MTGLAGSFAKPFAEQLAALRLRFGDLRGTAKWDDLRHAEHDRAFMVAGAMKADLLADLAQAVDRSVSEGRTLEWFRTEFRSIVERHGWHGWTGEGSAKGEAWRTRVIYKTNIATSYAAGERAQLKALNYRFWVYKHGNAREPRLQHLAWDGIALPPDHPFWKTHAPPNGWGCTCRIRGADTEAGIRRAGGTPGKALPEGWQTRDPRTGAPKGIDKGWDYAPGASVTETVSLAAKRIASLPAEIGSDFGAGMAGIIDRHWPTWLADTLVRGSHEPGLAGVMPREVIAALAGRGLTPISAEIMMKPGLISGPKAARHEAKGDALLASDLLTLPARLRRPRAILLDTGSGNLLYVLNASDGVGQLAIALDVVRRQRAVTSALNLIVSAYRPDQAELRRRLAAGNVVLLLGEFG